MKTAILLLLTINVLYGQVQYDSNALIIASEVQTTFEQGEFTVPVGIDRMIFVCTAVQSLLGTVSTDSVLFGQFNLTKLENADDNNLKSQIWYLPMGSGGAITDTVRIYTDASFQDPSVVAAAATLQYVDQEDPVGTVATQSGSGQGVSIEFNSEDSSGLVIGNITTQGIVNPSLVTPTGANQIEIFETSSAANHTGEGSLLNLVQSVNTLSWDFSAFAPYSFLASEFLISGSDLCPYDPTKLGPETCGCGIPDSDIDGDGTPDCVDGCPSDPLKIAPGICGCDIPDIDSDTNGIADCAEPGQILIVSENMSNLNGPDVKAIQTTNGLRSRQWSIGNLSESDSTLFLMNHLKDQLIVGSANRLDLVIDAQGKVGLGIMPWKYRLQVNGQASKSYPGDWLANSDIRLKKKIVPLDSKAILCRLLALKGISFVWDDHVTGFTRPKGRQYGILAQDMQQAFPELVELDMHGYLMTSYGSLKPMIIESMRALDNQIEHLVLEYMKIEQRVQSLEQRQ